MRFNCVSAQYLPGDVYIDGGTTIGDGTKFPIPETWDEEGGWRPSSSMLPLDDEAKALVDDWNEERGERVDPMGPDAFPSTRTTPRVRSGAQKTPNPNKDLSPSDKGEDGSSFTSRTTDVAGGPPKTPAPQRPQVPPPANVPGQGPTASKK